MSKAKKIVVAVFSIIIIGALAFMVTWVVINFDNIKAGLSGTELYTKEDIDKAYDDGFNTALGNKENYESLINDYKDTISSQTDVIAQLNEQNETLEKSILDYQSQVDALTIQRDDLLKQIETLNAEINDKNGKIDDLKREKQELIDQHQQTVNKLNAQIAQLNSQIDSLNTQIQLNMSMVNQLNARIAELQKTIAFYESFIGELETDDIAIVIFEFGGSVYAVRQVNKGDKVSVENPVSTEYLIFNGWTIDGQPVDLSEYTVTKSVRIIADVTYKYVVNFTVDGNVKYTQVVERGGYATEPEKPRKTNFTFKYWTLNGETEVDVTSVQIMSNTTFIAKFGRLFTVSFQYADGTEIVSRRIEEGTTTNPPKIPNADEHLVLKGWKLNGSYVDVASWTITSDTVFVADITYMYSVRFICDDEIYNEQSVEIGHRVYAPGNPSKDGYKFVGWYIDGPEEIIDLGKLIVERDLELYAAFEYVNIYNVTFEVKIVQDNYYRTNVFYTEKVVEGYFSAISTAPSYADYTFKGWSVDGTNVVDLQKYAITEDTTFKAVMQHKNAGKTYTVTYYNYQRAAATYTLTWGSLCPEPARALYDDVHFLPNYYYFWGWSLVPPAQQSGRNTPTIFLTSYVVTENLTVYPVSYYDRNGGTIFA